MGVFSPAVAVLVFWVVCGVFCLVAFCLFGFFCLNNRASFYFCLSPYHLIDLRVVTSKTKAELGQQFFILRVLMV